MDYVSQGIQTLSQFRSFLKEKSNIEREYAQKLESLTKKYKPKSAQQQQQQQQDEWNYDESTANGG